MNAYGAWHQSDEVQLNTNPLRMDAVIINKKLAAVFKTANILEYKNPDVYLPIDDFNRALAYCFLYSLMTLPALKGGVFDPASNKAGIPLKISV